VEDERWSDGLAAAGGTLVCCTLDASLASALVVSYIGVKAVREFLPSITEDTWYLPVVGVCVASSLVIPSGYVHPELTHPSMVKFMEYWIRDIGVSVERWRVPLPGKDLAAGILQPGETIPGFVLFRAVPHTAVASFRMMLPFYGLWTLASALRTKNLYKLVLENAEGLLRSITFQTGFSSTLWLITFGTSKYITGGALELRHSTMLSWVGGLWTLVERKGRRIELAAFFMAHAVYVLYRRSGVRPRGFLGALLLAIAMAPLASKWSRGKREDHNKLVQAIFH
jgi:hypothetical protein